MRTSFLMADLFSGAGGITEGFRQAGFTPVVSVEFDRWAAQTYAANFGDHVLACPIEDVDVGSNGDCLDWTGLGLDRASKTVETGAIDVLVGGPPCQGFSPLGRMNDWTNNDPRNKLWRHYLRVLETVRPKVFVVENVPELLKSAEFALFSARLRKLKEYRLTASVLNANGYGVPQQRKRAIVIGSRVGEPRLPDPVLDRPNVRDAIGDLSLVPDGVNWHVGRNPTATSVERYRAVPPGGNRFDLLRRRPDITPRCWRDKLTGSTDVFGRMVWHLPAPTIRTEFFKPEKGRYLHPEAHRPITIREAARLQTFPDTFAFSGSAVQVAKQIGNAVPIALARHIANEIRAMLAEA